MAQEKAAQTAAPCRSIPTLCTHGALTRSRCRVGTPVLPAGWSRRQYLALLHLYTLEVLLRELREPAGALPGKQRHRSREAASQEVM